MDIVEPLQYSRPMAIVIAIQAALLVLVISMLAPDAWTSPQAGDQGQSGFRMNRA